MKQNFKNFQEKNLMIPFPSFNTTKIFKNIKIVRFLHSFTILLSFLQFFAHLKQIKITINLFNLYASNAKITLENLVIIKIMLKKKCHKYTLQIETTLNTWYAIAVQASHLNPAGK